MDLNEDRGKVEVLETLTSVVQTLEGPKSKDSVLFYVSFCYAHVHRYLIDVWRTKMGYWKALIDLKTF